MLITISYILGDLGLSESDGKYYTDNLIQVFRSSIVPTSTTQHLRFKKIVDKTILVQSNAYNGLKVRDSELQRSISLFLYKLVIFKRTHNYLYVTLIWQP